MNCYSITSIRSLVVATLMALSLNVHADALSDLRAALTRLTARDDLTADFDVSRSRHSKGRFLNDDFDGSATFQAGMGPAGLQISFSRGLLDRANDEDWHRQLNSDRNLGTWETLVEVVPQSVEQALNASRSLLRLITLGKVAEQRVESIHGRPARVLLLRLPPNASKAHDAEGSTVRDDVMTVWIDTDGTPILTRRVRRGSVGIFLVHVDTTRTESFTYAVRGDHLVVTRLEDSAVVSGPGQRGTAKSVWSLRDITVGGSVAPSAPK